MKTKINFLDLPMTKVPMGIRYAFKADNGYGASIIQSMYSYGGDQGLWELAVLDDKRELCYDTPITNNVIGYLEEDEVNELLKRITELPPIKRRSYSVYQPLNGILNSELKRDSYEYEKIYSIDAKSLEDVFINCQNDFSEKYASLERRSLSVGDIIVDNENKEHYFVDSIGFTKIPNTVVQYIDWSNHM